MQVDDVQGKSNRQVLDAKRTTVAVQSRADADAVETTFTALLLCLFHSRYTDGLVQYPPVVSRFLSSSLSILNALCVLR